MVWYARRLVDFCNPKIVSHWLLLYFCSCTYISSVMSFTLQEQHTVGQSFSLEPLPRYGTISTWGRGEQSTPTLTGLRLGHGMVSGTCTSPLFFFFACLATTFALAFHPVYNPLVDLIFVHPSLFVENQ